LTRATHIPTVDAAIPTPIFNTILPTANIQNDAGTLDRAWINVPRTETDARPRKVILLPYLSLRNGDNYAVTGREDFRAVSRGRSVGSPKEE
jgi:hypothetical protein